MCVYVYPWACECARVLFVRTRICVTVREYMCVHMHVCKRAFACVFVCVNICVRVLVWGGFARMQVCVNVFEYAWMRSYVRASMHTCKSSFMQVSVHECEYACDCASECVWMRVRAQTCICAHVRERVFFCTHVHVREWVRAQYMCVYACLCVHMHVWSVRVCVSIRRVFAYVYMCVCRVVAWQ